MVRGIIEESKTKDFSFYLNLIVEDCGQASEFIQKLDTRGRGAHQGNPRKVTRGLGCTLATSAAAGDRRESPMPTNRLACTNLRVTGAK